VWAARHADLTIQSVAVSPDGKLVAAGGGLWRTAFGWRAGPDLDVRLLDRATGREVRRLKGPAGSVADLGFSPDGKRLVGRAAGRAYVWDVRSGELLHALGGEDPDVVDRLALAPDSKTLLTTTYPGATMLVWDVDAGRVMGRLSGPRQDLGGTVAFLPGARQVVVGSKERLVLFDLGTGKVVRAFAWPPAVSGVQTHKSLSLSPDGKRLLTACGTVNLDHRNGQQLFQQLGVRLWDVATGTLVRKFLTPDSPRGMAYPVAFLPDGRRFLTTDGTDGTALALWDADTGKGLHGFQGHTDIVTAVAVTPDGAYAVSGSLDRTVRLWRLPKPTAEKTDAEKLQGNWVLVFGKLDGKPLPADALKRLEIHFDTRDFELVLPGEPPQRLKGTFQVVAHKKQILLQFKDVKVPGIPLVYRCEGGRLALDGKLPVLNTTLADASLMLEFLREQPGKDGWLQVGAPR
jgi:uncharacterized protein (TIGR03067 family)